MGIDTSCLVVPELFNQLLQPINAQQPLCYKDFTIGALQQVCSENYAFSLSNKTDYIYKSKITDTKTIECGQGTGFPFLNKGEIINNVRLNRKFYLRRKKGNDFLLLHIDLYQFRTMNYLEDNETISCDDNIYQRVSRAEIMFYAMFQRNNVDIPVTISVKYISYTSSFQVYMKIVGADMRDEDLVSVTEAGEPLTLTRL